MFNICETLRFSYDTIVDKFNYADKYNSIMQLSQIMRVLDINSSMHFFISPNVKWILQFLTILKSKQHYANY